MLFWKRKTPAAEPKGSTEGLVRKRIYFSGRVQGVGFRFTAEGLAKELGLTGYVKNLWDGRVELEVQGTEDAISEMLSALRTDDYIRITKTEVIEKPTIKESRFTMVY